MFVFLNISEQTERRKFSLPGLVSVQGSRPADREGEKGRKATLFILRIYFLFFGKTFNITSIFYVLGLVQLGDNEKLKE